MKCKDCKHWQGTKYSKWGDCNRVVLALEPNLGYCFLSNEYGTVERYFTVPFDPHDVKYWSVNPTWRKLYDSIIYKTNNPDLINEAGGKFEGVRVIEEIRDDIIFDRHNGERVGKLKLRYFQTHKEFECNDTSV
jgi:hypothetical protein